ncbi:uncharacterized protein MYCFIDRAFT_203906 [Pseudocercospora fijiensis CIRAD86]|uniref:Metallo-beta-lactamase domain-containing protein n=1 Tax=Pseudocercospora fijiensis (strain CIRAD86) TaxID=383855 RepID=M2ZSS2_PSEFD|nr:uncharacterized protein MYCFIDRAFT_203906 [Pseudocercospora fijiensis CIRAD86]EME82064.1 hypothetical protein MYCFIDRAFT_203906 [Pseudocercospora fijiensis CIRAD86]
MSARNTITVKRLPDRNPEPGNAKAHHVGEPPTAFRNPWPSFKENASKAELFKLRFGSHPEKNFVPVPEGPNGARSEQLVKVLKPHWGETQRERLRATWIGHASFLVETPAPPGQDRGIRVLFDPVFSERTSPFTWLGPKRYTPTPCSLQEIPDPDVICISHDHYDHLDFDVVSKLYNKLKGRLHFFVGLNIKKWFLQHVGCTDDDVTEMDWWQNCELAVLDVGQARLTCCPTQHFSGRTPFNGGSTLWCSWALESTGKKLYFAGDTAYQAKDTPSPCPVFAQIGEHIGPFDLAMIPIGLYSPTYIAASVHVHPEQSLKIHKAIKSRLSVGMHYGTVRGGLSAAYEPVTDPPRRWREAAEKEGVGLCHVGETVFA